MKQFRFFVLFCCALLACPPAFAQWSKGGRKAVRKLTDWEKNVDRLSSRAKRLEAAQGPGASADAAQRSLWRLRAVDEALSSRGADGGTLLAEFTPLPMQVDLRERAQAGFWRKFGYGDDGDKLWKNEMARRSNSLLTAYRVVREKLLRQMKKEEGALLASMERTPLWDARRLVREFVPPSAKYIFVGEYHNVPEIQDQVADLVSAYRSLYPQRTVIFLTEYLEDSYPNFLFPRKEDVASDQEKCLLDCVYFSKARLAGLEEKRKTAGSLSVSSSKVSPRATLEGMRVRNAHWEKVIRAWRSAYPDAVFFIHGGLGHVSYAEPLSVSLGFAPEESFVVALASHAWAEKYRKYFLFEPFHGFTRGRFLRPGVITWNNRRYARMAGFDMQIIVRGEARVTP